MYSMVDVEMMNVHISFDELRREGDRRDRFVVNANFFSGPGQKESQIKFPRC